ncbi:MAG: N-acetylneuraminate synthase [Pseudomonadota bacterium]|nr:N-acetylneuraminate synthase [Pseudomonadota bacterium]
MSIFIIAEAGVNHNGNISLALELVEKAAEAGADAVKFQTFSADEVVSENAPKAEYQIKRSAKPESHIEMLKNLQLSSHQHIELIKRCREKKIKFLSSPFDIKSLFFLTNELNLDTIKIPSGEITNGPLLLAAGKGGTDIIMSTGMSTIHEIETALGVLSFGFLNIKEKPSLDGFRKAGSSAEGLRVLKRKVTLLQCTTEYPAPISEINLSAMTTIRNTFGLPVGISDHSVGITVPIAAAALGAVAIEKHFTLDRELPGPDHHSSIEPYKLEKMVKSIREVEMALGDGKKEPMMSEIKNKNVVRKSLVAAKPIKKGEVFSQKLISVKRPGTGTSPMDYWELMGERAKKDFSIDELL